jgi:hypothetical protein
VFGWELKDLKKFEVVELEMDDEDETNNAANQSTPRSDGGAGATLFMLSAFIIEAIMWGESLSLCSFQRKMHFGTVENQL